MKGRIISLTALFSAVIIIFAGIVFFAERRDGVQDTVSEQLVAVNEIEQLISSGEYEGLADKTAALSESIRSARAGSDANIGILVMCGLCIVFAAGVFGYVYFAMLRPFEKLKGFAEKISQGNFDVPLDYERTNYFGEFTWAFDSMRREIVRSRACEREAVENNKTVIATLEAALDTTPEKREKYLGVIMKKCDEVSRLTNDLFLHSLADLDKLVIAPERIELCGFMENAVNELAAERNDVHFCKPNFTAEVSADPKRLMQITENLIANARKYACSDIDVYITLTGGAAKIHFRDYGKGIPDADMPFIFGKFYRGGNCGGEQGSGLGLYIVKHLTEQMGGEVTLRNLSDGLEAVVVLPTGLRTS